MKPSSPLFAFGFLVTARLALAAPILTGIMTLPEGPRFCLVEEETEKDGPPPEWLPLGAVFEGYKLSEFDSKQDVLTLRRGDEVRILTLREAKIEPLQLPPADAVNTQPGGNLQLLSNEQLHAMGLHRIEKGDTLSKIASLTGVPIRNIMSANKDLTPINLTPGRIISLRADRPAPALVPPGSPPVVREAAETQTPAPPEKP